MSQVSTQHHAFWEQLELPAPLSKLSPMAYRALPETVIPMEHIDGLVIYPHWNEVSMSPTPRPIHQKIVGKVYQQLLRWIPDGEVILSPMDVRLGEQTVQPDVFWVAKDNTTCKELDTHYEGAPNLVVEVISPGSVTHDRITKRRLYDEAGIQEYWILDPHEQYIEVLARNDDGLQYIGAFAMNEMFQSPRLQREISVSALLAV